MKKFLLFVFSAGTLFGNAQIIYTDVNPDSLVTNQYQLDLNNDGPPEFLIERVLDGGINVVQASGISSHDSLAGFYGGFPEVAGYPFALSSDEEIGSNTNLVDEGILGGDHPLIMEDAEWPDDINRYLGLKFNISGQAHYGWAKIKISTDYVAFTVIEYAYNATPGASINSAATGVDENNFSARELIVIPNPCSENAVFNFSLLSETELKLEIVDLSGKLIFEKDRQLYFPGKQSLQLNTLLWKSGIYLCRISSSMSSSTCKMVVAP